MQTNDAGSPEHTLTPTYGSTPQERPFMETLLKNEPGIEICFDYNWPPRNAYLLQQIFDRVGTYADPAQRMSALFVLKQSAARYFMILSEAVESTGGLFTEQDFVLMLNTNCSPVWQWDRYSTVADAVAGDQGVGSVSELEEDSSLRVFLEKLLGLSAVQNAALVDVCERVWRDQGCASLVESLKVLGWRLAGEE